MSPRTLLATFADDAEFSPPERAALRAISQNKYISTPVTAPSEPERLLTTKEACYRLGVSRSKFYEKGLHEKLTGVAGITDSHPRYALSEVLALISSHRARLNAQQQQEASHAS